MNDAESPQTRFHWTFERVFAGYTLRDSRGYAQAILTHASDKAPWYGTVLAPGLPASPPCPSRDTAAAWVTDMMVKLERADHTSEFASLP